jgi:hypothetical protein
MRWTLPMNESLRSSASTTTDFGSPGPPFSGTGVAPRRQGSARIAVCQHPTVSLPIPPARPRRAGGRHSSIEQAGTSVQGDQG